MWLGKEALTIVAKSLSLSLSLASFTSLCVCVRVCVCVCVCVCLSCAAVLCGRKWRLGEQPFFSLEVLNWGYLLSVVHTTSLTALLPPSF